MKKVVVIGAGGFGREVLEIFRDVNKVEEEWEILGFVDDNTKYEGKSLNNYPVLGTIDWLIEFSKQEKIYAIIAIGDSAIREKLAQKLNDYVEFANIIHPNVIMSEFVHLGKGNIITAGCIISVNIEIGNHVIINLQSSIGHDCVIEDYCSIMPGVNVSGTCHLEKGSFIGTGACIIQNKKIGSNSMIGAGLTIYKDIPPNVKAIPKASWSELDMSKKLFKN